MPASHDPAALAAIARAAVVPGPGVVAAVSGGADSVAMLRLLDGVRAEAGLHLSVAHFDHGARGEAGRADAAFVADLAASLGLPFSLGHWSPPRSAHFEADAREARYAWLAGVARARGASLVAVGHTADDQAETVLHRIVRGTGLRGLAGIPGRRPLAPGVTLVRPLLDVPRADLRRYLATIGQSFREDATNADLGRTRNRIRHDLLPRLAAEYNPNVSEVLARLALLARSWEGMLDAQPQAAIVAAGGREIVLRCDALAPLAPAARAEVIRAAWARAGWPEGAMTSGRWLALASAVDATSPPRSASHGIEALRADGLLRLARVGPGEPEAPPPTPLPIPGEARWGGYRLVAAPGLSVFEDGEAIDLDRIDPIPADDGRPSLVVRAPVDGDRFDPLGLGGRTQALNDFFRGRRVAKGLRADVPLVCDRFGIVWVVGHRIADRVKRTDATRSVLSLAATPIRDAGCD